MAKKKWIPAVEQDWFIRLKGAAALKQIRTVKYWGHNVWTIIGPWPQLPFEAEDKVDFVFVAPARRAPQTRLNDAQS